LKTKTPVRVPSKNVETPDSRARAVGRTDEGDPATILAEQLEAVALFGDELAAGGTLAEGFDRAMRVLGAPLGVRKSALVLAEGEPPVLTVEVGYGMATAALRPSNGEGVVGRVIEGGLPVGVAEIQLESAALCELAEPEAWEKEGLSLVSVPVGVAGRRMGALSVYFAAAGPPWLTLRLGIVQVLAAFVAQRLRHDRPAIAPTLALAVERVERRMIEAALRDSPANLAKASRALGTTERILRYKLSKYGLLGLRRRPSPPAERK
jgi:hypothetical protein